MRNLKPRAVKPRIGLRSHGLYLATAGLDSPSWDCKFQSVFHDTGLKYSRLYEENEETKSEGALVGLHISQAERQE